MAVTVQCGQKPLIVSFPHTGTEIPPALRARLISLRLARKDTDWWIDRLYDFAVDLGATTVRTTISRTAIDVNRDPSGVSLYPGQATTGLCPIETFDGEPLYLAGRTPDDAEIARCRSAYFEPYHDALAAEVLRLKASHPRVVLYEAHSIRSRVPRLFDGELPNFNIGVNGGASCAPELTQRVEQACAGHPQFSRVVDGRFKGGWTTRHYGRPAEGIHALQMELACRGYMDDPPSPQDVAWPSPYDPHRAEPLRRALRDVLYACLTFAEAA